MKEDDGKDMRWKETWMVCFSTLREFTYHPHSIPIVPNKQLRKSNNGNAYIPQVISIGPRHRGRSELLAAEGIKWRYITSILRRVHWNKELLEKCMDEVLKLDAAVRTSYGDEINLDRYELANVMLFDGFFLLELLLSASESSNDGITKEILNDLMLVENQIPFVILETLYLNLFDPLGDLDSVWHSKKKIQNSVMYLFGLSHAYAFPSDTIFTAFHFLDFAYCQVQNNWPKENEEIHVVNILNIDEQVQQHLSRCATRLEAVGVGIKCFKHNENTTTIVPSNRSSIFEFFKHNVKLNKKSSNWRRMTLEIPQLDTTRTTEALVLWKNLIAWENHSNNLKRGVSYSKTGRRNVFTSSAFLFNDLICCTSDVQLLKNKGVILDNSGNNNQDIIDFFHSIVDGADRGIIDSIFANMFHEMNTYSTPATNYAIKYIILLSHYFSRFSDRGFIKLRNFLKRDYNFVATLITILTIVQTLYAVLSYHDPKKS